MRVDRVTKRTSKTLAGNSRPAFMAQTAGGFIVAVDADTATNSLERYKVFLTPSEVESIVLQVPARKLMDLLGDEGTAAFVTTLRKVLDLK